MEILDPTNEGPGIGVGRQEIPIPLRTHKVFLSAADSGADE